MTEGGYIHFDRSFAGHPAFQNDGEVMAFAWMCLRASSHPLRVRYRGAAIDLYRGQLVASARDLAEAFDRPEGWVERLLTRLKSKAMVETRDLGGGPVMITICDYDQFAPHDPAAAQ
ncbi:hypothetical protein [Sphingomonas paucimobilis]|uniref:hypothetical protein n=1 Tax=Sphingomonas paucimobilis TaxID=13689 RepID=UPI00064B8763|nr:hypothetical protein [Sphingomonas paucimobilis]